MVISHLFKACHLWTDFGFGDFALHYVRDKEKKEFDALITRDENPWLLAEIKLSERAISPSLQRFAEILNCERLLQIIHNPDIHHRVKRGRRIYHLVSASSFLHFLP